jgi:hypothetical protein
VCASLAPRGGARIHIQRNRRNGAEYPADIADAILDVPASQSIMFQAGFDFALDVAAAISEDPAHSPDLTSAIATAKARIAEVERDAA